MKQRRGGRSDVVVVLTQAWCRLGNFSDDWQPSDETAVGGRR